MARFRRARPRGRYRNATRRAKTDGDWIVLFWNEGLAFTFTEQQVGQGVSIALTGRQDLAEHDDNFTIHRIVGTIDISARYQAAGGPPQAGTLFLRTLHERIGLGVSNLDTGDFEYPGNLWSFDQAEESFLWHRARSFAAVPAFQADSWLDYGTRSFARQAYMDLRVKRKILPGTQLVYKVQSNDVPPGFDALLVNLYLRAWVKF